MRKTIFTLLLLVTIPLTTPVFPEVFEGTITPADNGDYKEVILPRLKEAKKSIHVVMFLASYYPRYPDSPTNLFLRELLSARKRGVKVEVIFDQSDSEYSSHSTSENLKTGAYLANNGIEVYLDSNEKTTHAKLIIIDEKFTVIGSANWSYSAMTKNNETSVLIDSPQLAGYYIKYFEGIKKECRPFLPSDNR